jgi:hypothetical protein
MIIVITGWFDEYDRYGSKTGRKEFLTSHGVDFDTGRNVILPCDPPSRLGAVYDNEMGEWVLL